MGKQGVDEMSRKDEFWGDEVPIKCPICGKMELYPFEICDCGWENDRSPDSDPDEVTGANKMSMNEARRAYKEGRMVE